MKTEDADYAQRLANEVWWKALLDVQRPYRKHLQGLELGRVLEIGCGVGRNLLNLGASTEIIGVDHNPISVAMARERGLSAFTVEEFLASEHARKNYYDSVLIAHVLEHMKVDSARGLVAEYLPYLRQGGRLVIITPQQAGFDSDPTHVTMMDPPRVHTLLASLSLRVERQYSFPFPAFVGRIFKYNEYVAIARN